MPFLRPNSKPYITLVNKVEKILRTTLKFFSIPTGSLVPQEHIWFKRYDGEMDMGLKRSLTKAYENGKTARPETVHQT